MRFLCRFAVSALIAGTVSAEPALAVTYLESDTELLAATFPPQMIGKLSEHQINDLKVALNLMTVPAVPEELARILAVAKQTTRDDSVASAHVDALSAETGRWVELGRAKPDDLHQFLAVQNQITVLPVIIQMTLLTGKTQSIDALLKASNDVARTPFGKEALLVRKNFADLVKEEKPKADANAPGGKQMMLVLASPTADIATAQLTKAQLDNNDTPTCDSVTWLPAFESEPGARYTHANGWEKPEKPCR